jgi:phosphatidate cytidylyltransferase
MAAWGIPVILVLSYMGSYYFLFLVLIINAIALWEFYTMFQNQNIRSFRILGVILSSLLIILSFLHPIQKIFPYLLLVMRITLIRHLKIEAEIPSTNTTFSFAGIIYISLFLISLLKLRQEFSIWLDLDSHIRAGGKFLVLLWISVWVCDTFAYFGGKLFGKNKLSPKTSPNKTIEGAIFGIVGAFIIFLGLGKTMLNFLPSWYLFISAIIVGVFGQMGDLVESRFKRDAGVKDTSTILPGHGGFLDRFDSIIFVAPIFFILFYLF